MLNHLRQRTGPLADERGSLVLGMSVIMIVTMLSIALTARTLGNIANVRHHQDFAAALATADAGLADATFRIDQEPSATFSGTGSSGDGTYAFTATRVDQNEWSVMSEGVVNGVEHAIEATISRPVLYPYALFADQTLTFNGSGGFNVWSYNSTTGLLDTGNAVIGSNHAIVINGGGGGDAQHYYTPNGSCSGCSEPEQQNGPYTLDPPELPEAFQPCPPGGAFPSTINGQGGLAFRCDADDVSFAPGPVAVTNPPAIVYVGDDHAVDISSTEINLGGPGADFRLLKHGTGAFSVGNGAQAGKLNGVVYAPETDIVVNGGQMHLDGSITVNTFTVNGNPNFELAYDDSIAEITSGDWRIRDWREIPSSSFSPGA